MKQTSFSSAAVATYGASSLRCGYVPEVWNFFYGDGGWVAIRQRSENLTYVRLRKSSIGQTQEKCNEGSEKWHAEKAGGIQY